jgi:uncharacterized SAM-binding protein YcdF (DUF218 family)
LSLRKRLSFTAAVAAVLLVVVLTSSWWLRAAGHALIRSGQPQKADAIIVLAGDATGARIVAGCRLAEAGFAPIVLVSGPVEVYGNNEADLAIRFATSRNCDPSLLRPVYMKARSTEEEAREFERFVTRHGFQSVLLVTSNYHTRRSYRTFRRRFGEGVKITPIAAPNSDFNPDAEWWRYREAQKTVLLEYTKTFANWIGL